jgi:hypothetical protein
MVHGAAKINSINLKENCREVKALRVGAKIWWTFQNHEKKKVVAYRLKLLKRLKIHLAFYVSYLRPFHEDQEDPEWSKSQRAHLMIHK